MSKFIKVADNNYTYINVDYIVRIDYTPRDNRLIVEMTSGNFYKISVDDAEMLLKESLENE